MSTINLRQQIENYNDLDCIRIVVVESRNGSIKARNEEITTVGVLKEQSIVCGEYKLNSLYSISTFKNRVNSKWNFIDIIAVEEIYNE